MLLEDELCIDMQKVSVKVLSRNFVYQRHFYHHGDMNIFWISLVLHVIAKINLDHFICLYVALFR